MWFSDALSAHNFRFFILFDAIFTFEISRNGQTHGQRAVCMRRWTKIRKFVMPICYVKRTRIKKMGSKIMLHFALHSRECVYFCRAHSLNIPKINNNYSRRVDIFSGLFFCHFHKSLHSLCYFIIALRLQCELVGAFLAAQTTATKTAHWLWCFARTPFFIHDLYLLFASSLCVCGRDFFRPFFSVFVHLITVAVQSSAGQSDSDMDNFARMCAH